MAKLLVVDDEADIVRFVVKTMEARGHQVATAIDGVVALDRVRIDRPDVIIIDLNLPRMDGFEVCRRLKTDPVTSDIPIVMMSASYVTIEDARRGSTSGADEYVIKPFLREVLVHNVERLLPGGGG
jgi:twitching motility two-component system response regulator PilH